MDTSARREDLVETDQAQKRLDNPRSDPVAEGVSSNKQTEPQDQVRPDIIRRGPYETFVHGAGI
jgi:hypothetical protein